jgi:hypothetical protein
MRIAHSKLILWFTSDKATLVVVVPDIVALLAQLVQPQLVVSTLGPWVTARCSIVRIKIDTRGLNPF